MHYAPKILKHYLTLAVESASPLDSDVHAELETMTEAFDDLFGRMHTHEPEPTRPTTEAVRRLRTIAKILHAVPVPVGGTVNGVRWLAKEHKENKQAWRKREVELINRANENQQELGELERLLSTYYDPAFSLKARVRELLALEKLGKAHNDTLCKIADLLTGAGVPSDELVKRVEWLVKRDARQIASYHKMEKSLDDIKYNRGNALSSRVAALTKDYVLVLERLQHLTQPPSMISNYDECMDLLDEADVPPGLFAKRVATLVESHNAEQAEIHKVLDDAWACPASHMPLLLRVRALVRKYRRLRNRSKRSVGVNAGQHACIKEMLDKADLLFNENVATSVRKTVEYVEDLRRAVDTWHELAQERLDELIRVETILSQEGDNTLGKFEATRLQMFVNALHEALTAAGVPENEEPLLARARALPDYEALAGAVEALDENYDADWWTTKVLEDAANIVRNWGR